MSEHPRPGCEPVLILEPGRAERHYWRDIWAYRELFAILAWRDIAIRYKQTVIGAAWAVVRPFLTMVVFTVVFGQLANLPSEGTAPYPLMVFAGIWTTWTSTRKVKEGEVNADLYGFLTCEPNAEVAAVHPKAMPVILTTAEEMDIPIGRDNSQ